MPFLSESIFLTLVLLAAVGVYLAWPFLTGSRRSRSAARRQPARTNQSPVDEASALEERHRQIVMALRDLDFDHDLGKVTDEDYAVARAQLMAEGSQVLRAQDAAPAPLSPNGEDLEHEIAARRKRKAETRTAAPATEDDCPQCGRPSTSDDVFCPRCGTRLSKKKVSA